MEITIDSDAEAAGGEVFPALRALGLGTSELEALRRKGHVTRDRRGSAEHEYWRLRFRLAGRHRAVYLGRDRRLVEQVRQELILLQSDHRRDRRLAKLTAEASVLLRAAKRRLEPLLERRGFHYHGQTIRKKRDDANVVAK